MAKTVTRRTASALETDRSDRDVLSEAWAAFNAGHEAADVHALRQAIVQLGTAIQRCLRGQQAEEYAIRLRAVELVTDCQLAAQHVVTVEEVLASAQQIAAYVLTGTTTARLKEARRG